MADRPHVIEAPQTRNKSVAVNDFRPSLAFRTSRETVRKHKHDAHNPFVDATPRYLVYPGTVQAPFNAYRTEYTITADLLQQRLKRSGRQYVRQTGRDDRGGQQNTTCSKQRCPILSHRRPRRVCWTARNTHTYHLRGSEETSPTTKHEGSGLKKDVKRFQHTR